MVTTGSCASVSSGTLGDGGPATADQPAEGAVVRPAIRDHGAAVSIIANRSPTVLEVDHPECDDSKS
jgi:hypothetical protein